MKEVDELAAVLLVIAYSRSARERLRNCCRTHDEAVVRRFGRAALLASTEFGAFLACWLRAECGDDVQVERTEPFNEFEAAPDAVRTAAWAYADRDHPSTPYSAFAAGTDHPDPDALREREL